MKNITIKQVQLFDRNELGILNIWEKNRFVMRLIKMKAKGGELIFEKEIKLKKAFDKAYEEAIDCRQKVLEAHSKKKKIVYLDGHEEETLFVVGTLQEYINDSVRQLSEVSNENVIKAVSEQIEKYKKLLEINEPDEFGKSVLIKSIDGIEVDEKKVLKQAYDLINIDDYNKEFEKMLLKEITLDCLPIKLSSLSGEDCTSLNGYMEHLEDFITTR